MLRCVEEAEQEDLAGLRHVFVNSLIILCILILIFRLYRIIRRKWVRDKIYILGSLSSIEKKLLLLSSIFFRRWLSIWSADEVKDMHQKLPVRGCTVKRSNLGSKELSYMYSLYIQGGPLSLPDHKRFVCLIFSRLWMRGRLMLLTFLTM